MASWRQYDIYPGHGPLSTFGRERLTNPYVSDFALGIERNITKSKRSRRRAKLKE